MKKLFLACLLAPALCRAQDSTDTAIRLANPINYLRENVWRVLFLSPGVSQETRLGVRTTLASDLRLGGAFVANGSSNSFHSSYYLNSVLSSGVRYYYNLERRLQRGKSIRYNSANYLTLRASYSLPPFLEHHESITPLNAYQGLGVQAMWGFQRTYRRNFYLNLALGLGVSQRYTGIASDFALGYTFSGKPQRLK